MLYKCFMFAGRCTIRFENDPLLICGSASRARWYVGFLNRPLYFAANKNIYNEEIVLVSFMAPFNDFRRKTISLSAINGEKTASDSFVQLQIIYTPGNDIR